MKRPIKKGKPGQRAGRPIKKKLPRSRAVGGKPIARKVARAAAPGDPKAPRATTEGERLQKVLASAGVASRRECEALILEGRIEIDGRPVTELGVRVDLSKQRVSMDGEPLAKTRRVYFAVNKPEGVVSTTRDPAGRPRVIDLLPPHVGRVFNVGRLDLSSEGLILVTNDGELANRLTHPRHGVEKVYHVQVAGLPTPETLAQLRKGVYLAEGRAHFEHVRLKSTRKNASILEVVLDEGRNREIRRLLARVGHKVQRLTRIAVGPVRLGELPSGAYRPLTDNEVKALVSAASGQVERRPKRRPPVVVKTAPAEPTPASVEQTKLSEPGGAKPRVGKKPAGARKPAGDKQPSDVTKPERAKKSVGLKKPVGLKKGTKKRAEGAAPPTGGRPGGTKRAIGAAGASKPGAKRAMGRKAPGAKGKPPAMGKQQDQGFQRRTIE